jgi:hypothetical protein
MQSLDLPHIIHCERLRHIRWVGRHYSCSTLQMRCLLACLVEGILRLRRSHASTEVRSGIGHV